MNHTGSGSPKEDVVGRQQQGAAGVLFGGAVSKMPSFSFLLPLLISLLPFPCPSLPPSLLLPFKGPWVSRWQLTIRQMRVCALYACWYARWCSLTLFWAFMRLRGGGVSVLLCCSNRTTRLGSAAREINQSIPHARPRPLRDSIDCCLASAAIAGDRKSLLTPS